MLFFFNDTATTEIYTLSLHDALPISYGQGRIGVAMQDLLHRGNQAMRRELVRGGGGDLRSEEHTSELQSRPHLVCRLLLEKKKEFDALNDVQSCLSTAALIFIVKCTD